MIKAIYKNGNGQKEQQIFEDPAQLPDLDYIWIDLLSPTASECRKVEEHFSIVLLNEEQSNEIEASSKIIISGDLLVLNVIYVNEKEGYGSQLTPVSFYLFSKKLLTLRTQDIDSFNNVSHTVLATDQFNTGGEVGFLLVAERIDHAAMKMREMIITISALNKKINMQRDLGKDILNELNERMEYLLMFRIAMMNKELTLSHLLLMPDIIEQSKLRLKIMQKDVKSLLEYSEFSINRLDYMLTTFTAYLSIEQNNSMKVFTMVSVVSTPAILIVGFYGMNFENIPLLHTHYGYLVACILMVIMTIGFVIWFKSK